MFSVQQKRDISDAIQKILRGTNHPELPEGEISFWIHIEGEEPWMFANIRNNGAVTEPAINPWNEQEGEVAGPSQRCTRNVHVFVTTSDVCRCGKKKRDAQGNLVDNIGEKMK